MARGVVFILLTVLSVLSLQQAGAGRQLAAESPKPFDLSKGLIPYLEQSPQYSLFLEVVTKQGIVEHANGELADAFEGLTNTTVFVVNDTNLRKSFRELAEQYQISSPDNFADRLINNASVDDLNAERDQPSIFNASDYILSTSNYAYIALLAFINSHLVPTPIDLYSNQTILTAPYQSPFKLNTDISVNEEGVTIGSLQAYTATNAPGPATVYVRQEGGLLHAKDGLAVPRNFLTGSGDAVETGHPQPGQPKRRATLNVYELDGIFLYGQNLGQFGAIGRGTERNISGTDALKKLSTSSI